LPAALYVLGQALQTGRERDVASGSFCSSLRTSSAAVTRFLTKPHQVPRVIEQFTSLRVFHCAEQKGKNLPTPPLSLLAFAHIHKAAGTTLLHILRRNFFLRHMDVRPFRKESNGVFRARDLQTCLRLNPFLRCISGHSVRTWSDLEALVPNVQYITILRDPINRFVSHFLYRQDVMKSTYSLQEAIDREKDHNLQTKYIAGSDDLEAAKRMLEGRFLSAGVSEEFDAFLLLLRRKLEPAPFDISYVSQNLASRRGKDRKEIARRIIEENHDALVEMHQVDLKLYDYLKNDLLPREKVEYGPAFERNLAEFQEQVRDRRHKTLRPYIDYAVRKCYYEPVTGLIRVRHGKPYYGGF
jgi:hypothetical protein